MEHDFRLDACRGLYGNKLIMDYKILKRVNKYRDDFGGY